MLVDDKFEMDAAMFNLNANMTELTPTFTERHTYPRPV